MAIDAEMIAAMTDQQLKALDENVRRLGSGGSTAQRAEAERLTPLIEHERATRKPAPKATPVRAKKTATKKAKAAAEAEADAE